VTGFVLFLGACMANRAPPAQAAPTPAAKLSTVKASPRVPAAVARMQEPGPEARALAKLVGRWDVAATFRASPSATPIVTKGLIADREMVGLYLQETMKPAPSTSAPSSRETPARTSKSACSSRFSCRAAAGKTRADSRLRR
jgi:hypothetical protein